MNRGALALVLLVGCGNVGLEGYWIGVCEAPGASARVEVDATKGNDSWSAAVTVYRPDRPDQSLGLWCTAVEERGREASITGCQGTSWDGVDGPSDLWLSGTITKADPVPVLEGDCGVDGLSGRLELWWVR